MRDDFSEKTKNILAKRVGMHCSNPDCCKPTSGPRDDPSKVVNIGVAAHITAASPDGPRYDPSFTPDERVAITNGIWLCQNCAKLIDTDISRYSITTLLDWKNRAEKEARRGIEANAAASMLSDPDFKIAPSRLTRGADKLFGREDDLKRIGDIWNNPKTHILTIIAWGGTGKTSLIIDWTARMAADGWIGFERVFDWSFYSQGTREQGAASSDSFVAEALKFFGNEAMANSPVSPWEKGAHLAQLIAAKRTLLVLDGLEPLQHPPGPLAGQLKDPAINALLRSVAQQKNPGLCIITTRERVADLAPFHDKTVQEWELKRLSTPAGLDLLKTLGVQGSKEELEQLAKDVNGHALTLNLIGRFLVQAFNGDIRKRDLVNFEEADAEIQGGHAFRVMEAYERWLAGGDERTKRSLAVLRLLGLFDRPADAGCLAALRTTPTISSLTEPIVGLSQAQWNIAVSHLVDCGLILRPENLSDTSQSLDTHPLIRKYFAKQLREKIPEAWREGNQRLFNHLSDSVPDFPEGYAGLQPLYQAIRHGCMAEMYDEACKMLIMRIERSHLLYSTQQLGALSSNLGAVSFFFESHWNRVHSSLDMKMQAWLLNFAAFCLRGLGALTEAIEPLRVARELNISQRDWREASRNMNNLSELDLALGDIAGGIRDGDESVQLADREGIFDYVIESYATLAEALHQNGQRANALARFEKAERFQVSKVSRLPILFGPMGFKYCELLLSEAERTAWQIQNCNGQFTQTNDHSRLLRINQINQCQEVYKRAKRALPIAISSHSQLSISLTQLIIGRASLYRLQLYTAKVDREAALQSARKYLTHAVDYNRSAGQLWHIPGALLTRSWLRFVEKDSDGSIADLHEAWEIAQRGNMKLYIADIHLHHARLFRDKEELKKARAIIEECRYLRRKEELEDAEDSAKQW
jgi:tetratricopeptide (TPR) repeat protein